MGYSTDFDGEFTFSKPLTEKQFEYINQFSASRRMKRDVNKLMELYKGKSGFPDKTVNENTPEEIYGIEGAFYVGDTESDGSVIEHNTPPGQTPYGKRTKDFSYEDERKFIDSGMCQPGLWCQWIVEGEGTEQALKWDGGEKFYEYVAWLKYLIDNFFKPWEVKLNGEVEWIGESNDDRGKIVVKDNVVEVYEGTVVYTKS